MNPFRPPITSLRWGAVAVGLVLAVTRGELDATLLVGAATLVGFAAWRTRRPLALSVRAARGPIATEALVHVAVVAATGSWESPFAISLLTAVVAIGFARGYAAALGVGAVSAGLVAAPYVATASEARHALGLSAQWTVELLLVAAIAGYARRFSVEAAERHGRDLDRLERLAEANTLLHSLHDVAQALPASLDVDEALDSVVARLRSFFELTAVAVFLRDERDGGWTVARQQGTRLPTQLPAAALPSCVAASLDPPLRARRTEINLARGGGIAPGSRSGLYAPLCARGEVVALVAVEHEEPRRFSPRDAQVIDGFAEGAALAIDNARRFARLRRASADEERSRIAGELHDRVGQSLACMAFEIDLLVRRCGDVELQHGLQGLGRDLRAVIADIRDTLSDLRTDVSEARSFEETVETLLARVNERRGTKAVFHYGTCRRLPLASERVLWRIVAEAVNQALRQGECSIEVWWACDGTTAQLEVVVDLAEPGEDWSRAGWTRTLADQAAGIGAVVDVDVPVEGTSRLRCSLAA